MGWIILNSQGCKLKYKILQPELLDLEKDCIPAYTGIFSSKMILIFPLQAGGLTFSSVFVFYPFFPLRWLCLVAIYFLSYVLLCAICNNLPRPLVSVAEFSNIKLYSSSLSSLSHHYVSFKSIIISSLPLIVVTGIVRKSCDAYDNMEFISISWKG